MVLTHGAGSNRDADLLVALDRGLTARGIYVERVNLAFRSDRPKGPPRRDDQLRDQVSLQQAVERVRSTHQGPVWIGGHSYGGRMASMLLAREPRVADGLLLLGYPLHPPKRPEQPRTAHWPDLKCPLVFVSGSRDAFGSPEEFQRAFTLLAMQPQVHVVEGAGHDLKPTRGRSSHDFASMVNDIADVWIKRLTRD